MAARDSLISLRKGYTRPMRAQQAGQWYGDSSAPWALAVASSLAVTVTGSRPSSATASMSSAISGVSTAADLFNTPCSVASADRCAFDFPGFLRFGFAAAPGSVAPGVSGECVSASPAAALGG